MSSFREQVAIALFARGDFTFGEPTDGARPIGVRPIGERVTVAAAQAQALATACCDAWGHDPHTETRADENGMPTTRRVCARCGEHK
jgi:hypothetical protein